MSETKGLARVNEMLSTDRFARAKELRAAGKHVFGYVCCFAPLEMPPWISFRAACWATPTNPRRRRTSTWRPSCAALSAACLTST